jgi:uncharacterized protein
MNFKLTSLEKDRFIAPSWEEMGKLCFDLAKKVISSDKKVNRIVPLAKGGWTWAKTFSDYTRIKDVASLKIDFYKGVYETSDTPVITQSLPISISGENVLLFDDVSDTGKTLEIAKSYLSMCGAKTVFSATLFMKPWTKFIPDYYGDETDAWVIFPHEIREMIDLLSTKWAKKGLSLSEIKDRLINIGISYEEVNYFLK